MLELPDGEIMDIDDDMTRHIEAIISSNQAGGTEFQGQRGLKINVVQIRYDLERIFISYRVYQRWHGYGRESSTIWPLISHKEWEVVPSDMGGAFTYKEHT